MDEFHGYALSVTNHLSHDNPGQKRKRAPIKLDPVDTSTSKLPNSYAIQYSVELSQTDVFARKSCASKLRPQVDVHNAQTKDEVCMAHERTNLKKDILCKNDIITWSGCNSMFASNESVKPPAIIGTYPLYLYTAASASYMKPCHAKYNAGHSVPKSRTAQSPWAD